MSAAEDLTRRVHDADKAATRGPWTNDDDCEPGIWGAEQIVMGEYTTADMFESPTWEPGSKADRDLIATYRTLAVVLARMVDDVLNRHTPYPKWSKCRACHRDYPCPERVALDRIAKDAQP